MPKRPLPHQRDALRWSSGKRSVAFFKEMRLGKSFTALRWSQCLRRNSHTLVVAPLSVIPSWISECDDEGVDWYDVSSWNRARLSAIKAWRKGVYLTNYESLYELRSKRSIPNLTVIGRAPWSCVILDESPRIKAPKAKITKSLLKYLKPQYRALLSGLPDPEGVMDFVTQMIWLNDSFMGCRDFWQWRAKYCSPNYVGQWAPSRKTEVLVNDIIKRECFVLTRKQAGMSSTKVRQTLTVKLPAETMREVHRAINDFEVGDAYMTNSALAAFTLTQQLTAGTLKGYEHTAKVAEIKRLVVSGELKREPVVIFCRFNEQVKQIHSALLASKVKTGLVTGATPNRRETVKAFQDGKIRVLVAQTKCLKEGVDLSVASTIIFASNYHSYDIRAQAEDRCFHPEKDEPILILDVIAHDTPDDDIPILMQEKAIDARGFQRAFLSKLKARKV